MKQLAESIFAYTAKKLRDKLLLHILWIVDAEMVSESCLMWVIKVVVKDVFAMKVWTIEVPTKTLQEDEQYYIGGKLQKLFQVPEPGTVAMTGDIYREVTEELQDEFFDESVEEQVVEWCLVTQIGGQFVCPWKKLIKY